MTRCSRLSAIPLDIGPPTAPRPPLPDALTFVNGLGRWTGWCFSKGDFFFSLLSAVVLARVSPHVPTSASPIGVIIGSLHVPEAFLLSFRPSENYSSCQIVNTFIEGFTFWTRCMTERRCLLYYVICDLNLFDCAWASEFTVFCFFGSPFFFFAAAVRRSLWFHLERNAWSVAKLLGQAINEYAP